MKTYIGIDLHSTNCYFALVNEAGKRLYDKRIRNHRDEVLKVMQHLESYGEIEEVAIESTYNWYWLVDLLREAGYPVVLANPSRFQQYEGLKVSDDKSDAYYLAEMLRLEILPKCWICPKKDRPVRDLLRGRMFLVEHRSSLKTSLSMLMARYTGFRLTGEQILNLSQDQFMELGLQKESLIRVNQTLINIHSLERSIKTLESEAQQQLKLSSAYQGLASVPGIGKILALVIMLETGDVNRFKKSGNYTSYCRCVGSECTSNGKKKGTNNKKNGNRYLSWAYHEAAMGAKRWNEKANGYYQRKLSRSNSILATRSLAAKLTKTCYYIIRDEEVFHEKLIFG